MDRETIERHLAQAEMHVSEGERHVVRQREIVGELEPDGRDLEFARKLLANFEAMYAMHVADRDHLRELLARLIASSRGGRAIVVSR